MAMYLLRNVIPSKCLNNISYPDKTIKTAFVLNNKLSRNKILVCYELINVYVYAKTYE